MQGYEDSNVQGYLAHKIPPPPPTDRHKSLGMVLLEGPRRVHFLISEIPLYIHSGSLTTLHS